MTILSESNRFFTPFRWSRCAPPPAIYGSILRIIASQPPDYQAMIAVGATGRSPAYVVYHMIPRRGNSI